MENGFLSDHLLDRAPELLALTSAEDILVHACREALAMTGAKAVFGAYAPTPGRWVQGLHRAITDAGAEPLVGPCLSAAFGIHRRVAKARDGVSIERGSELTPILDGLAVHDPALARRGACLLAVPIVNRKGRFIGELAFAAPPHLAEGIVVALRRLCAFAAVAFENAVRLAAARRDQDRLLLLAETTGEALWDWNLDTDELWWGGGIQHIAGSGEHIRHDKAWKLALIHPDDRARVEAAFDACLASADSIWTAHYRFRRAGGEWAFVEERGYFLREPSGRVYRAVGAIRDVTALHASNEALRENQERLRAALEASDVARSRAVEANRAKDEFLAMLGHELRNPLSPMSTALQLMRLRGAESKEVDVLERQVAHLARLVDDLLDVSRITGGKIVLRKGKVDLSDVVARALEMTTPVLEERRQVVEMGVPRGILIDADAARTAQVLSNLLTNAAKYSDPDSTIRIEGERVGGEAVVRVVDEGMGIAPEMLDRVFDVFVQQPQTLDRSQGGLGLGLTIVKSLVELHGGRVMVNSEGRGKGSIFTVVLPTWASESSHDDQVREASPESSRRGRRILIVDDNADGAEMLCAALEHLGHRVEVAHDGPSAIGVAERFLPDIALLDIGLPVMDGYELASRLRGESTEASSLRLIAITGYGQEEDRRRTSAAGFDMHLVKPIDFARLVSAIDGSEQAPAEAS